MRSLIFAGPLGGAQGEAFRRQLLELRGPAAAEDVVDTGDAFDALWRRVRACLAAGATELRVADLEPAADSAYLDWLRGELAAIAAEFEHAPRLRVTGSALGRQGLDARVACAALEDESQLLDCRDVGEIPAQPDWSRPPPHRRHLFLCTGPRCVRRGALPLWKTLRRELASRDLIETPDGVLMSRSGCQFPCNRGPILTVYPDRCWYSVRDPEQVRRLVQEHLEAGRPVAELLVETE